jgi:F-type H+-transporting ATPase subunit b
VAEFPAGIVLAEATPVVPAPVQGGEGTTVETPAEHKVFPPFDATTFASQLFWFAITFVIFYFVIKRLAIPRIGGIIADRRARIAADLDEAEQAKQRSEAAAAAYEKQLAEARAGAFRIAEEGRSKAKAAADAERARTESDLAGKLAAAEARIGEIKAKALADVGAIAAEAAEAAVKALADVNVGAKDVADAVGATMKERAGGV